MKAKSTILLLYIAWLIAAVMLVFAASGQYRSIHIWVKGQTRWQLVADQLTALAAK